MIILAHIVAYLSAVAGGSCVLVFSLWLLSEKDSNPLADLGLRQCFIRAAVLCVVSLALQLLLPAGLITLVIVAAFWWGAIMFLFERTLGQAFLLGVANSFLNAMFIGLRQ